ncbi:hypothetical protein L7F22_041927 [Adiantum nelumboides]|nr:hypothetical protein [Adiantum nelumboides]
MEILVRRLKQLFTGSLLPRVGNLITLHELCLDNNHLQGLLPTEVGMLANLMTLTLSSDSFIGVIPRELGTCSELATLDLDVNKLSGQIPKEIGNLPGLDYLVLSYNQFFGTVPDKVCSFATDFNMPDSMFAHHFGVLNLLITSLVAAIPGELSALYNLISLDLSQNALIGSIPSSLGELGRFKEIGNLPGLDCLVLFYNQYFETIPDLICWQLLMESGFQ